jgi:DNA-binding NarL/FixJ family response regulator
MPKNILMVDDSPEIRKAVRTYFFERETDFQICGQTADGLHADTISAIEASAAGGALVVSKMHGMSVLAEQVGSLFPAREFSSLASSQP